MSAAREFEEIVNRATAGDQMARRMLPAAAEAYFRHAPLPKPRSSSRDHILKSGRLIGDALQLAGGAAVYVAWGWRAIAGLCVVYAVRVLWQLVKALETSRP